MKLAVALAAYIGAIVAANVMASHYGLVGVGFGLLVPAGTFAAGFALVARDFVHKSAERFGRAPTLCIVLAAIGIGAELSYLLTITGPIPPVPGLTAAKLAMASAVAFGGAEILDFALFAAAKSRFGFVPAIVSSNIVSAPLDTVVFLWLSGFGVTLAAVEGQLIGKLVWATAIPVCLYVAATTARERVTA